MTSPAPGVVYHLDAAAGLWVAPGRDSLPALTGFRLGVTEPTRDSTGAGTDGYDPPTKVLGDGSPTASVTVRAGEVLEDTVIRGWVNLHVGGTIRNCRPGGQDIAVKDRPLVNVVVPSDWDGKTQAIIDHCTVQPLGNPAQGFSAGVAGKAYRITRSKVAGCIDGLTVSGGATVPAVTAEGCWIGDLVALRPDPWGYWPATHNDAVQWHGCTSMPPVDSARLVGCSVDVRPGPGSNVSVPQIVDGSAEVSFAGIMVSKPTGKYAAMTLDRCWLRGGNQTINAVATDVDANLVVTGCRFERGTADGGSPADGLPFVAAYVESSYSLVWEGNEWIGGGTAAPVRRKS